MAFDGYLNRHQLSYNWHFWTWQVLNIKKRLGHLEKLKLLEKWITLVNTLLLDQLLWKSENTTVESINWAPAKYLFYAPQ